MNRHLKPALAITILILMVLCCRADCAELCERVSEIKQLPFKGERIDDAAYNSFLEAGEAAIPCLIDRITVTTKMRDPRQAPTYSDVRVGDVAYFMLVHLAKIEFVAMLPERVQDKYKTEGVFAYFDFVRRKQNREWLQRRLREWYRRKHG
jgi:hypothetical protein